MFCCLFRLDVYLLRVIVLFSFLHSFRLLLLLYICGLFALLFDCWFIGFVVGLVGYWVLQLLVTVFCWFGCFVVLGLIIVGVGCCIGLTGFLFVG